MTYSESPALRWTAVQVLAGLLAMLPPDDGRDDGLAGRDAAGATPSPGVGGGASSSSSSSSSGGSGSSGGARPAGGNAGGAASQRVEALVALAQAGDSDAFGMLYQEYVDSVYWFVLGRVGHKPLAEDLTAETFVRALRRLDTFSWQGRDIGAWFFTIARNLVTDHRRSSRYRLEISTDDLLGVERHGAAPGNGVAPLGPEEQALAAGRDRQLVEAVRRLRPDQQECIVLRFFHDLSIAQTALALGRSEGAVKQLQLRAVRALAQIVEDPT